MGTEFFKVVIGVFPVELLACQVSMFCTAIYMYILNIILG